MKTLISDSSIVRTIWGTTDITLFIFAGAAAEFALNKQVDWLYYTGKLPADPIGRLFSTVKYAQQIIFTVEEKSLATIDRINQVHQAVESSRQRRIPEAAYKDVLYMLIYYSIASFELLQRKMTAAEKDEVVHSFRKIGERMHLYELPENYTSWQTAYRQHLQSNLANGELTKDLFTRYRRHLGGFRYYILLEVQRMLVSPHVNHLLKLGRPTTGSAFIPVYRLLRKTFLSRWMVRLLVPHRFHADLLAMEQANKKSA